MYFQAAATVYAAVHKCLEKGLNPDRLGECFHERSNPLAAPELMRLLMDDCGFSLERACRVAAYCCDNLNFDGISPDRVYPLQPRTAHVVSIMRHSLETIPVLIHNSRRTEYRSIGTAVETGRALRLAFLRKGGRIRHAELVLRGDDFERSMEMEQEKDTYYVNLILPDQAQALWYSFYVAAAALGGTLLFRLSGDGVWTRLGDPLLVSPQCDVSDLPGSLCLFR